MGDVPFVGEQKGVAQAGEGKGGTLLYEAMEKPLTVSRTIPTTEVRLQGDQMGEAQGLPSRPVCSSSPISTNFFGSGSSNHCTC